MFHGIMPATFKDIHKAHQISVDVGMRVLERIANACLRGQVNDPIRLMHLECIRDRIPVFQIESQIFESWIRIGVLQSGFFQRNIVVIIEVINTDHLVPTLE